MFNKKDQFGISWGGMETQGDYFVSIPSYLLKIQKHVSDGAFMLLMNLVDMMGKNQTIYPSYQYLADRMGKGNSTIRRLMNELINLGLVVKEKRITEKGKQTSNLYAFGNVRLIVSNLLKNEQVEIEEKTENTLLKNEHVPCSKMSNELLKDIYIGQDCIANDKEEHLPYIKAMGDTGIGDDYLINRILEIIDRQQPSISQFNEALNQVRDCELSGMEIKNYVGFISHKIKEVMENDKLSMSIAYKNNMRKRRRT